MANELNTVQKLFLAAEKIGYVRGVLTQTTDNLIREKLRTELWQAADLLVSILEEKT